MHRLRILTLLLTSTTLLLNPLIPYPQAWADTSGDSPSDYSTENACEEHDGYYWNESAKSCQSVAAEMASACQDKSSKEEKIACLITEVQNRISDIKGGGGNFDAGASVSLLTDGIGEKFDPKSIAGIASSVINLTFMIGVVGTAMFLKEKCPYVTKYSLIPATAAAVMSLSIELWSFEAIKKVSQTATDRYAELVSDTTTDTYKDLQSQLFTVLRDVYQDKAYIEKVKAAVLWTATALYGAAIIVEIAQSASIVSQAGLQASIAQCQTRVAEDQAKLTLPLGVATLTILMPAADIVKNSLVTALLNPVTTVAMYGFGLTTSTLSAKHYQDASEVSALATALFDEIKGTLSSGDCSETDRTDLSNPTCYCYLEDGQRDPNKKNSLTCQTNWKKYDLITPSPYLDLTKTEQNNLGCMTLQLKFDPGCRCRQMKNASGENACLKSGLENIQSVIGGGGTSALTWSREVSTFTNKILSGSGSGLSLSQGVSFRSLAKRAMSDMHSGVSQYNQRIRKIGKGVPIRLSEEAPKLLEKIESTLTPASKEQFNKTLETQNLGNFVQQAMQESATKGEGKEKKTTKTGVKYLDGKPQERPAQDQEKNAFSFAEENQATASASGQEMSIQSESSEDPKYKIKSIATESEQSIWTLLSQRYLKSGYEKIFRQPASEAPTP